MPNRIIKESICTSDSIEQLSWFEEIFFYRLVVNCDDFGRMDARTQILKARLFPLKNVTEKQITEALNKLSTVGIAYLYEFDNKPYLQLVTWESHQSIRNKKSKFPPKDIMSTKELMEYCEQLNANDFNCTSNPIQSESKYESEYESYICSEQEATEPALITLPLNNGEEYPITESSIREWSELYPVVDVMQCLRNMKGWLNSNKAKRKTHRGINRFITTWLQKEQDKGGTRGYTQSGQGSVVEEFANSARGWANG